MLPFTVIMGVVPINDGKKIISANKDKTFLFRTIDCPLDNAHKLFSEFYVLSRPLTNREIETRRDTESLDSLYSIENGYVVVDLDEVKDIEKIVLYCSNNNYQASLFKSRRNLKGVFLVDFITTQSNVEAFLNFLHNDLEGLCEVDISSSRRASYQSPFSKEEVVYYNDSGYKPTVDDIKDYIQVYKQIEEYKDVKTDWFWNHFCVHYGMIPKSSKNANGTIQCSLPTESKTKFSYYWSEKIPWLLMHPNKTKTLNIFDAFLKSPEGRSYIKEKKIEQFKIHFNEFSARYKVNTKYFELTDETKYFLNDYDVLQIKGIMGSGKSNILEYLVRPKTLFISVRKSLSYDIQEKYKCKHYLHDLSQKDKNCYRNGDSLVIQIDSLHKVNLKNFNLVVIDEFESLCIYTQNNMLSSDNFIVNMRMLKEIFETKKLVIADAFLNNFSTELYFQKRKVKSIENVYKDDAQVYNYKHMHTFITVLEKTVHSRKKNEIITCSFGTKDELLAMKQILEERGIRVISISADLTDEAKKMASKLLSINDVKQYDVVMFTPTITVGVSILNNVAHHFHFDKGKSVDVISSIQMTKRSRSAVYIHVYTEGRNAMPKITNVETLNQETLDKIKRVSNLDNIMFNYDTNDVSSIGRFINCFIAHKNFYTGNHKNIFDFLLHVQYNNVVEVNELISNTKFDLMVKSIKQSKTFDFIVPERKLDTEDFKEDYKRLNLDNREYSYQVCLEAKLILFSFDDETIIKVAKESINSKNNFRYLRNILFFNKYSPQERKQYVSELTLKSLKNVLVMDETITDFEKLCRIDFDLYVYYTKQEVKKHMANDIQFCSTLKILGYKAKNNGYVLPKFLQGVI